MKKLIIIFIIVVLFLTTLGVIFAYKKVRIIENDLSATLDMNKQLNELNKELSQKTIPINLNYNKRTNELIAIFTGDTEPHTCVWTIWGDHGTDSVVITKIGGTQMYTMESYDYVGHLLSDGIEIIKTNKFLPLRVPIYVTCVDWQNRNYYGSIGEYK